MDQSWTAVGSKSTHGTEDHLTDIRFLLLNFGWNRRMVGKCHLCTNLPSKHNIGHGIQVHYIQIWSVWDGSNNWCEQALNKANAIKGLDFMHHPPQGLMAYLHFSMGLWPIFLGMTHLFWAWINKSVGGMHCILAPALAQCSDHCKSKRCDQN